MEMVVNKLSLCLCFQLHRRASFFEGQGTPPGGIRVTSPERNTGKSTSPEKQNRTGYQ
jgi:hypothetical protein